MRYEHWLQCALLEYGQALRMAQPPLPLELFGIPCGRVQRLRLDRCRRDRLRPRNDQSTGRPSHCRKDLYSSREVEVDMQVGGWYLGRSL